MSNGEWTVLCLFVVFLTVVTVGVLLSRWRNGESDPFVIVVVLGCVACTWIGFLAAGIHTGHLA